MHKKLQITFKYRKRKVEERRWYVSEIDNILKENQEIYDANQRELNSLQLELVKSVNISWLHFFLRPILFIQEPTGMNLNDSHYFAN